MKRIILISRIKHKFQYEKSKEKTHVEKILSNLKPPNKPDTNLKDKIDF